MCNLTPAADATDKRLLFNTVDAIDALANVQGAYDAIQALLEPRSLDEKTLVIEHLNLYCLIGCVNSRFKADLDLASAAARAAAKE